MCYYKFRNRLLNKIFKYFYIVYYNKSMANTKLSYKLTRSRSTIQKNKKSVKNTSRTKTKTKKRYTHKKTTKTNNYLSLRNDIYIIFRKEYCRYPCNPSSEMSRNFHNIQKQIDNIKRKIKRKPLIKMFNNLIYGDSRVFYKHKLNSLPNSIKNQIRKTLIILVEP